MKNTFGSALCLTIFGESHGAGVGRCWTGWLPASRWTRPPWPP